MTGFGIANLPPVSSIVGRNGDFQLASGTASYVGDRMNESIEISTGATAHDIVASFGASNSIFFAFSSWREVVAIESISGGISYTGQINNRCIDLLEHLLPVTW